MSKILWFQLLWVFFLKFDELYKLILIVVQATDMFGSSKFFCSSVTVNWIFGWYLQQQSKEKYFSWSLLTPVSPPGVPDWLSVQVSVTSMFSGPTRAGVWLQSESHRGSVKSQLSHPESEWRPTPGTTLRRAVWVRDAPFRLRKVTGSDITLHHPDDNKDRTKCHALRRQ